MPKYQRDKGKRGERLLAAEVREAFPEFAEEVRRGWQSREGDDDPDVDGIPNIWWEHKFGAKPNPRAALEQAIRESAGRRIPIAVIRDNHRKPCAYLKLSDLFYIMRHGMNALGPIPYRTKKVFMLTIRREENER